MWEVTRPRILTRDLRLLLAGFFAIFVNTTLLVPVLPAVVARTGGSSGAGLVTACFYFPAVATQLRMPQVMRRHSARRLLIIAFLLLGLPCFAYLAGEQDIVVVLAATAVRGVGFGIATVVSGTLIAALAPTARRGTVLGYSGLAAGIPPVFAPAAGVYLLHTSGAGVTFVAAGVVGITAALISSRLRVERGTPRPRPPGLLRALVAPAYAWPFSWFLLISLSRGAAISFVPLRLFGSGLASASSFLLCFGTLAYIVRYFGGRLTDRVGPRTLVIPGALFSLAGLVLLASGTGPGPLIVASGVLFGTGYGLLATTSQMDMISRAGPEGFAVPTTLWNIAIDCGVGLGGVLLGVVATVSNYTTAFWVLPGVIGAALALILLEPKPAPREGSPRY